MPVVGKPIEIHANFRFTVAIDNIDHAAFTECTLPSLQVQTEEVKEGGQNEYIHKLPVRVQAGSITLRHGITKGTELLKWYLALSKGEVAKSTRDVTVVMYDSTLKPIATWTFHKAYPIKWSGPTLKAGEQALAIEELELAHHGFEFK